jgi:hypothetical protein
MKTIMLIVIAGIVLSPLASLADRPDFPYQGFIPQYRGIRIIGTRSGSVMEGMKIEPTVKVFVDRFTRIQWVNDSDAPIRIKFRKGENCKDISRVSQQTQDWWSGDCFITKDPLPPRAALQIMFDEPGEYPYEVQFVETKSTLNGEIITN